MRDLLLWLIGVALAIMAFVGPYRWHDMPGWLTTLLLCVACAMIGAAVALMIWGSPRPQLEKPVRDTSLFLQFSDSHTVPKSVSQKNIRYWYALFTESIYVKTFDEKKNPMGGFEIPPRWTVFLIFDKPAIYRQMVANCAGPNNPHCAVQYSNANYAIITVVGDVSLATLEISVLPLE